MLDAIFRGAFFKILIMMFVFFILVLALLEQAKKQAESEDVNGNQSNMSVSINWPPGDTDVDLWMDAPFNPVPVGYSNKGGRTINLLRDDLGTSSDPDPLELNFENAYVRGLLPGRYTVNVHCYRCPITPVPIRVEVRTTSPLASGGLNSMLVYKGTINLNMQGQERTAVEFYLKDDGSLDPASITQVFRPLRSAAMEKNSK